MEINIYCAVLAGGIGSRMGAGQPKQFMRISGRTVLARSVGKFLSCEGIDHVFVTSPPEYLDKTRQLLLEEFSPDAFTVLPGGADRNGSIENVIGAIRKTDPSADAMLITHDGARPFVPTRVIDECVRLCREGRGSAVTLASTDTIAHCENGEMRAIPPRSLMHICQTPQCFPVRWFERDYYALSDAERAVQTDACGMFLHAGRSVATVEGARCNIKLTTQADILLAELYASLEDKGEDLQ